MRSFVPSLDGWALGVAADPVAARDYALIEVLACGVCEFDSWSDRPAGHEIVGRVISLGEFGALDLAQDDGGVTGSSADLDVAEAFAPGTRVLVAPVWSCGTCRRCALSLHHLCVGELPPPPVLAERMMVPHSALVAIPDHITDFVAATIACPLAGAISSLRRARVKSGDRLLITSVMTGVGAQVALVGRWLGLNVVGLASTDRERRVATALGIDVATVDDLPPAVFVAADTGGDVPHRVFSIVERGGAVASFHPRPNDFYSVSGDLGVSLLGHVPAAPNEIREAVAIVARGAVRPAVGAVVSSETAACWLNGTESVVGPGRTVVTFNQPSTNEDQGHESHGRT